MKNAIKKEELFFFFLFFLLGRCKHSRDELHHNDAMGFNLKLAFKLILKMSWKHTFP